MKPLPPDVHWSLFELATLICVGVPLLFVLSEEGGGDWGWAWRAGALLLLVASLFVGDRPPPEDDPDS